MGTLTIFTEKYRINTGRLPIYRFFGTAFPHHTTGVMATITRDGNDVAAYVGDNNNVVAITEVNVAVTF